jgi:hypothetical protein
LGGECFYRLHRDILAKKRKKSEKLDFPEFHYTNV